MAASETPIINGSTVHSSVSGATDEVTLGTNDQCESRTEESPPRTSPEPDPQRMDDEPQTDGALLKEAEPASPETAEQTSTTGPASEPDTAEQTAS